MAAPFTVTATFPVSPTAASQTRLLESSLSGGPTLIPQILPSIKPLPPRLGIPTQIHSDTQGTPTRTESGPVGTASNTSTTDFVSSPAVVAGQQPSSGTEDHSSSGHSSKVENETSEYARTAVIISAVTLILVLLVITAVALFLCRRKAKRKVSGKEPDLFGSTVVQGVSDNSRQRDEESYGGITSGDLQFNSLNMVVSPVRRVPSMIESHMGSLTTITNPPPPYRNQSRSDLASPRSPAGRESSLGVPTASIGGGGGLLRVPENGFGGNQAYNLEAVSRLLPASVTVRYTFSPTSLDELQLSKGDKLQVTGIFDDGWCLCRTERGKKGVVPLASLDLPGVESSMGQTAVEDESVSGNEQGRLVRTESRNVLINVVAPEEGPAEERVSESLDASVPHVEES